MLGVTGRSVRPALGILLTIIDFLSHGTQRGITQSAACSFELAC